VVVLPPPTYTPALPSLQATDTLPTFITDGLYQRYLTPGETVVVLSRRGNAGMLFQADADFYFRIAGGFINASLNSVDAIPLPVALLSDPSPARVLGFFNYVHAAGVGAIIVERAWSEKWMYFFSTLGLPSTTVGGVTVYSTSSAPVVGLPEQELSERAGGEVAAAYHRDRGTARSHAVGVVQVRGERHGSRGFGD
jgi:hypothetical protein